MRMTTKFVKSIDLFLVRDQVVNDENTLCQRYNALSKVPFLVIDQTELEVIELNIVMCPIEQRTKKWLENQMALLQQQGVELTYKELEDDIESETNSGTSVGSLGEDPKSPLVTRSSKRKVLE